MHVFSHQNINIRIKTRNYKLYTQKLYFSFFFRFIKLKNWYTFKEEYNEINLMENE